ncbi:MAG TPA: Crp/Fnr family transcriptional regulator [Burkholderiaceae bacterium]|jgi:CRP-like cAMP-binding protein
MPTLNIAHHDTLDVADIRLTLARRLLARNSAFRDCPAPVIEELVSLGQLTRYEKGEILVQHSVKADYFGLVVSGLLECNRLFKSGNRQLTGMLATGEVFNLLEVADRELQFGEILARATSVVLRVPTYEFNRLQLRESRLAIALSRALAARLNLVFQRSAASTALPLEARTAAILQILVHLYGLKREHGVLLDVKLSQEDLADLVGVSRQRLNFALKRLEADGIVQLGYASLVISDPERLAQLAETHPG